MSDTLTTFVVLDPTDTPVGFVDAPGIADATEQVASELAPSGWVTSTGGDRPAVGLVYGGAGHVVRTLRAVA